MPVPPVGYGEFSMWFRLAGDPEEQAITCGIQVASPDTANLDAMALDIYQSFVGSGLIFDQTAVSNTLSAVRCDVRATSELVPAVREGSYTHTTAGTRTTSPPPSNCALFVRKTSGAVGRRYKGRFYFPAGFLKADDVSPTGAIEPSSALPTLQTRMAATYTALVEVPAPPVINHSIAPFTPTPVISFAVQPVIATQRRRLRPG